MGFGFPFKNGFAGLWVRGWENVGLRNRWLLGSSLCGLWA